MVLAGLSLNPAGFLLFRNRAPQSSLRTKWPLPRSPLQADASSFFRASESNVIGTFLGMVLAGLGLNPAGVLLFRNRAPQSSLRTKWPLPWSFFPNLWHVLLGFRCFGCIVHSRQLHHLSLGRQKAPKATLGSFAGAGFCRLGHFLDWRFPSGVGGMGGSPSMNPGAGHCQRDPCPCQRPSVGNRRL